MGLKLSGQPRRFLARLGNRLPRRIPLGLNSGKPVGSTLDLLGNGLALLLMRRLGRLGLALHPRQFGAHLVELGGDGLVRLPLLAQNTPQLVGILVRPVQLGP